MNQAPKHQDNFGDTFDFAMGEHTATFPRDRLYATNHMWAIAGLDDQDDQDDDRVVRLGLTAYAVRLLQDVYFLDWLVEPGATIPSKQHIGSIESKKAESDLYAPVAGVLHAINDDALNDPSVINADTYGDGWMIEIKVARSQIDLLLSPDQYAAHLEIAWEVAQKTIKGQANT